MSVARFVPSGPLRGTIRVPSDKSITHRALMIAAVAESDTVLRDPLWAGDTRSTARCLQAMGVRIEAVGESADGHGVNGDGRSDAVPASGDVLVRGVGLDGLRAPREVLDAGNSGTTVRLLAGLVSGGDGKFRFDGDDTLRRRPMERVVEPLRSMGVGVSACDGHLPLTIAAGPVQTADYVLPVASAQVKSCVLLAALHADGVSRVTEPVPTRDHTERMLRRAGADLTRRGQTVRLTGRPVLSPGELRVPGDASSAAFLVAAAALVPGSDLTVTGLGLNPTRIGFFETLREMGADVVWSPEAGTEPVLDGAATAPPAEEPVGTLTIRHAPLHGVRVPSQAVPLMIDELPLLALVATAAAGETVVDGAGELRVKESDRLAAIARVLHDLGARVDTDADSFRVIPAPLVGGRVESTGDHRLAMLGAVAGLASRDGVAVNGFEAAAVSFPAFETTLMEVLHP